jgi:hypothetical protein
MPDFDLNEIKRSILAAVSDPPSDPRAAQRAQLLEKKRKADTRIVAPLADSLRLIGTDLSTVKRELAANQRGYFDALRALENDGAAGAAQKRVFDEAIELRRSAFGNFTGPLFPTTPVTIVLPEPLVITQTPNNAGILLNSTIAPFDSRAKVNASGNVTTGTSVDFWYFCSIDNSQATFIEAFAPLTVNGWVGALLTGAGIFDSELLRFAMFAQITVYDQDATHTALPIGLETMLDINISHNLFDGDASEDYYFDYTTYPVRGGSAGIKSGGVLLRLSVYFSLNFREGLDDDSNNPGNELWCDFANDQLNYFIQSPYMQLQVGRPGTQATA